MVAEEGPQHCLQMKQYWAIWELCLKWVLGKQISSVVNNYLITDGKFFWNGQV